MIDVHEGKKQSTMCGRRQRENALLMKGLLMSRVMPSDGIPLFAESTGDICISQNLIYFGPVKFQCMYVEILD